MMPNTTTKPTVKTKYVMVEYTYIVGEYEMPKYNLLEGKRTESSNRIVSKYFKDFFGEETIKEDNRYYSDDYEQCIKVGTHHIVPENEALIILKHMKY